jgi:hypothetical protein
LFPELPSSSNARAKLQVSGNVSLKNILGSSSTPPGSSWGANSLSTTTQTVPEAVAQNRPYESDGRAPAKETKGKAEGLRWVLSLRKRLAATTDFFLFPDFMVLHIACCD